MINKYPSYAVAIRTLGAAGDKYIRLLNSILNLVPRPKEVIVVLPEGYKKPDYSAGIEKIVYSKKGMIEQRLAALDYISSEYILFCDDDVEFGCDFVSMLFEPLLYENYSCSAGPLLEFFPPKTIKYAIASALGGACIMLHNTKKTYVRILKTGGWSYNHNIALDKHIYYDTDSLPWTCFFIKSDVLKQIHFEDEIWSEKTGYAAFEDRAMFYKLKLNGFKTCVVSDAQYIHNDAKTSMKTLKLEPIYARAYNHYVFWHRYIYSFSKNTIDAIRCKLCINYYIIMQRIYHGLLVALKREDKCVYRTVVKGFRDAKQFCNSEEYRNLNPVIMVK